MNLADMLTFADIGQLSRIANHYQCECNGNSKHELIQSILQTIGRREFIEHHVEGMSLEDLRFLNGLIFDGRRQFSLEELIACAQQSRFTEDARERESPRDVIARFRQRGWLFQGMTHNTRYLFEVPEDLKRRFREALENRFRSELMTANGEPAMYREEPELLSEDLILFLRYVQEHEIPLNNEGVMYRRNQLQILEKLHISEALVGKGWRFGYGRRFKDYPNRLSLLYDYASHCGWIRENTDRLILTTAGETFLAEERREPMMQFVYFWLRLYKGPIPNLLSLAYWIERCSREWVTASSLYDRMSSLIKPFFYDSPESIFEERILRMMLHLGMVRLGEDGQGVRYVQTTPFGKSAVHKLLKG
ncbi:MULTISPECIES: hypothetical protein [Paenibacillus]|uniref:Helicase XPB/Ssl2 N-terminal domain-containing protein n=1 Tax=Paenibacillus vini TaxID=1476024 RepID=A0ABQ4MDA5_9BACL|nr:MULTISPECIES: hypothetical protein [Paenibacillus]MBQ4898453.1 hypothetical protein [Paenibacillus sp. Marseille-P2973]MDN4071141.1 hypothetical protein [Paenibacillus vini]GIP53410.1 hypothetical protein J42TS3_24450 [Paenibacillus vini]